MVILTYFCVCFLQFGWYGAYEDALHFSNAVGWVSNVCMVGN